MCYCVKITNPKHFRYHATILLALLALAVVLLPVEAHARLVAMEPAAGAVLDASPLEVRL